MKTQPDPTTACKVTKVMERALLSLAPPPKPAVVVDNAPRDDDEEKRENT